MDWLSLVGSLASVATAIGVFVAGWQIRLAKQLARTQFEDTLTKEFREIIWKIPVDALIGLELSEDKYRETRDDFFRYIDLSNEQVFLRKNNRISKATWELWRDGMKAFLARPSFNRAWREFREASPDIFKELRRLEDEHFKKDPCTWVSEAGRDTRR
jgi:hypothetical protein